MSEIIREIQKKDRKFCLEIITSCLYELNSRNYTTKFIEYIVKSYKKNFMKSPEIKIFIIEKDGNILGTGSISAQGQIRDVFIDIQNHRKGLGKKMMEKLENEAKLTKIKTLFLYAAISAFQFYEKIGYIKRDQLDHGGGDLEIKMEKNLELN